MPARSLAALALFAATSAPAQQCLLTYHAPPPYVFGGNGAAVYHAGLQRVLIVDTNGASQTRIWAWDGSTWSVIQTGGPGTRTRSAIAYDSGRNRLVLFGGANTAGSVYFGDTWEWDGSSWTQRAVVGPSPRAHHGMAHDESRQRTVLFGGYWQPPAQALGDTWEWDGQAWVQSLAGGPGAATVEAPLTYDSLRARTLYYKDIGGGRELWEWDGAMWSRNLGSIPSAGLAPWMVFDRSRARLVMGGNDIWEFDPISGQSTLRQPGSGFTGFAAFDTARSRAVIATFPTTLEYDGTATATSPYILAGPIGGGTYEIGSTFVLSIQAGGSAPLALQWRHDGQPLVDGGRISGATTQALTVTSAMIGDSGQYTVALSNACTATTSFGTYVDVRPECYANCDGSTTSPILSVNDFICFLNEFAAGHLYANCDQSNPPPILNVNDFVCFQVRFAQGCP